MLQQLQDDMGAARQLQHKPTNLTPAQRVSAVNNGLDPYGQIALPVSPTEYFHHFKETTAAIMEVTEFLAAQEKMEIFSANPNARALYKQIIEAGFACVFHYRNRP